MNAEKILQELKNDYKTAEEWLLFYNEREAQYEADSRYILDESPAFKNTGKSTVYSNSYTEYKVVQLESLDNSEKWLTTIKLVESMLSPQKQIFLEMRRRAAQKNKTLLANKKRRTNWILFVQQHYFATMTKKSAKNREKYWLSEKTIENWWQEIVNATRIIALKRRCVF